MNNVLILGANGSIARQAIEQFLEHTDARLTLYLRNTKRLGAFDVPHVRVIEGDVMNKNSLKKAMVDQNVVYANLYGNLEQMAHTIIEAMNETGVKRLIFISYMGIYGEVPGQAYHFMLDPYRKSADIIEASNLDYTIVRPGWFTNKNEIDYKLTRKGEPFQGREVSRKSVADFIVTLAQTPDLEIRSSVGISKV